MNIVAVPVKPFGLAKARLASEFNGEQRANLGMATAAKTVNAVLDSIGAAFVVTANHDVATWAVGLGASVIEEDPDQRAGLDGGCTSGDDGFKHG